jgi:hypothetical protein
MKRFFKKQQLFHHIVSELKKYCSKIIANVSLMISPSENYVIFVADCKIYRNHYVLEISTTITQ